VGLRKLLTRQTPAEDPLERLAELGRELAAPHPPGLFFSWQRGRRACPVIRAFRQKTGC
jgi:hypothetical protein